MVIIDEPATSDEERANDAYRFDLIKNAIGAGASLRISLHKLLTDDDEDLNGLYSVYFVHELLGPLFMCTIEGVFDQETALSDAKQWLVEMASADPDKLESITLDFTHAPALTK